MGGRGLGSLRLQASFCSSSPFLVGEAAGGGALPGCVGMAEKSILLKWFGSPNFTDCGSNTGIFSGTLGESFLIQFSYNGNGSSIPDFGDSHANQPKEYVCHPCPKVPGETLPHCPVAGERRAVETTTTSPAQARDAGDSLASTPCLRPQRATAHLGRSGGVNKVEA